MNNDSSNSKRNFLKGTALAAMTLPALGMKAAGAATLKNVRWDHEYDVVVVGYGGAGAAAAIGAHDGGAKVLIIEKLAEGGGNTAVSSGGFMIPDNVSDGYTYLSKTFEYANSEMDEAQLRVFCEESLKIKSWASKLADNLNIYVYGHAGFKTLPGAEAIKKYRIKGKRRGGDNLFDAYRNAVETVRKIPVMLSTPAKELISRDQEVLGVVAMQNGKPINIRARRGVILTTGGFEFNQEMLQNYVKGNPVYGLGSPGNTGDGILMAQQVGAKLWHMTATSCPLGIRVPGLKTALQLNILAPSHIWVDQDGKRFVNEKGLDNHTCLLAVDNFDSITHRYSRIPCYVIFDEAARKRGPITGGATSGYAINREGYVWSKDNSAEVASGVIKKADTLEALAKLIKVPAANLKASVDKWNADFKLGGDQMFGRPINADTKGKPVFEGREAPVLSAPIGDGPYYAAELMPTLLNTQGGPKRNVKSEVLDSMERPIPRLYAAGELGSIWGMIYQGATNNAESMVFGLIAGRNAATQKPWA